MMSGKCEGGRCEGKCGGRCWCKVVIRVLVAAIFIYAGYNKLTGIEGTAAYIASAGLPSPVFLAWAAGLIELVAGVLVVAGCWGRRYAAWTLILFTIVATYFFHVKTGQTVEVLKNLAIIGGLAMLAGCAKCGSCEGGKCGDKEHAINNK